jgi:hypothetical protein
VREERERERENEKKGFISGQVVVDSDLRPCGRPWIKWALSRSALHSDCFHVTLWCYSGVDLAGEAPREQEARLSPAIRGAGKSLC